MESISILSFLSFLVFSLCGAYYHYRKVRSTGRHNGSLYDYLIADYPGRTGGVWLALIGAAWGSATSGIADNINPQLLWSLFCQGQLHIPSVNVAILAATAGYTFDSAINKGSEE